MKKSIFGMLLMMEGLMLVITLFVSLIYREDDWLALLITAALTTGVGLVLRLLGRGKSKEKHLSRPDSFFIVTFGWVLFSLFGMLPFILHMNMSVADAFFEAMSGFTTTGASVISDIDGMTHGLRFWRSIIQWIGGLGIIVFSFALIPAYEMKNSNVYSAEVTGLQLDKLRPKIGATARRTLFIYILLSTLCTLAFWIGPMNLFDSICHAMCTLSTGGFSTHSASIGYFKSAYVEYVCAIFMLLSSLNFSLYYYLSIRRSKVFFRNEEMRSFFFIVGVFVVLFFLLLMRFFPVSSDSIWQGIEQHFRTSLFHVSTIISSSGFAAEHFDYVSWGVPFWMPTLMMMAIGACAGSTGGGIKVQRILICFKNTLGEFVKLLHHRAVLGVKISGQIVPNDYVGRVLSFISIYCALVIVGSFILNLLGNDFLTSVGSCVSMLSNIGPGMGTTGPSSNFYHLHDAGKWLMSFLMLVGRLELFTVLFLFMPHFWKEK